VRGTKPKLREMREGGKKRREWRGKEKKLVAERRSFMCERRREGNGREREIGRKESPCNGQ